MVRRSIELCGKEYNDVLEKGKEFYKSAGAFVMIPFLSGRTGTMAWYAAPDPAPAFKIADGFRRYQFDATQKRWKETN